jgi:hypothetical protein
MIWVSVIALYVFSYSFMKLSSVDFKITATYPTYGFKRNIDPPLLGWAVELSDDFACEEPVKGISINIVTAEIIVLQMKNHFIPP